MGNFKPKITNKDRIDLGYGVEIRWMGKRKVKTSQGQTSLGYHLANRARSVDSFALYLDDVRYYVGKEDIVLPWESEGDITNKKKLMEVAARIVTARKSLAQLAKS